jgi:cytochrome P450
VTTVEFDPFDPSIMADPYPVYARMRERDPVYRSPSGCWVLFRHRDCAAALQDRRLGHGSVSRPDLGSFSDGLEERSARAGRLPAIFAGMDPPDHTRIRRVAGKGFTPPALERLVPRIQSIVDELVDTALGKGEIDVLADLSAPLSLTVLAEILDIPVGDREQFQQWVWHFIRGIDPSWTKTEQDVQRRHQAVDEMLDYFRALLAERRAAPGADFISSLVRAENGDLPLTEDEVLGTCVLLLVAGFDSSTQLVGNGLHALLTHPAELARLRADPILVEPAIEETLRWAPPASFTVRTALTDLEIAGHRIGERERVLILILAGNRDPEVFANPDDLDAGRISNPHLSFGRGIHHCLGAPLARLEGRLAFGTLLRRARQIDLTGGTPQLRQNVLQRGFTSLPIALRG